MRLVVFCDRKYIPLLPRFKKFFKPALIEPHFYAMDKDWDLKREKSFQNALSRSDEYLVIGDRHTLNQSWLIYLIAHIHTQKKGIRRMIFFMRGSTSHLPAWMKEFNIVKTIPRLLKVWKKGMSQWTRHANKEIAAKKIKELGSYLTVTDFFMAAGEGDLFLFSLYLEAGFSPNAVDKEGVPILCHVIRKDYVQLIPRLLFWGADVNMIAHDRANTPIMEAASKGMVDIVSLLIEKGAGMNHASKNGQTALILAVGNGQIETAQLLLESGADIAPRDQLGMDARKYAELYGYEELLDTIERMSRQ